LGRTWEKEGVAAKGLTGLGGKKVKKREAPRIAVGERKNGEVKKSKLVSLWPIEGKKVRGGKTFGKGPKKLKKLRWFCNTAQKEIGGGPRSVFLPN